VSGICGSVSLDGRPADRKLLHAMAARMSPRGPNGVRHWAEGPVAFAHAALHTTPESLRETQPLTSPSGLLCLTLDGRVDNRGELKAAIEDKSILLRDDTDAELVLRAYELWGEGCAARILGDFAFAIWDAARHYLFCARDILGFKPFYYFHDGRRFLFASEPAQILEDSTISRDVNEGMVGEFLSVRITNREETLYNAIYRLPPAHFLIVGPQKFRKQRYWDIDLRKQLPSGKQEEYSDEFFEIFREAVRCRMRSVGPVGAELSGGLDSSSVVGMAQYLIREGSVPARGFESFSAVFPGLRCDETPYIRDVSDMWGLHSNRIVPKIDTGRFAGEVREHKYVPTDPTGRLADSRLEIQARRGFQVILTGWGGDDWLGGDEYPHADLLRNFKVSALLRQIRSDRAQFGLLESGRFFLNRGVLPLLPRSLRAGLRHIRSAAGRGPVPWIPVEFSNRIHLQQRGDVMYEGHKFQSDRQKARYWYVANGWTTFACELWDRSLARYVMEQRHPFCDRRVIEFAFALPQEQLCLDGRTKIILRSSMRDLLPEGVRERSDKAEFSFVFGDVFESMGGERLFDSLHIASLNLVDAQEVRTMAQELLASYRKNRNFESAHIWPLWMVLAVELWFTIMGDMTGPCVSPTKG
jgi:asparagine synthase (glutamine-hydrolysing)